MYEKKSPKIRNVHTRILASTNTAAQQEPCQGANMTSYDLQINLHFHQCRLSRCRKMLKNIITSYISTPTRNEDPASSNFLHFPF